MKSSTDIEDDAGFQRLAEDVARGVLDETVDL
jgi:hypothetical protein